MAGEEEKSLSVSDTRAFMQSGRNYEYRVECCTRCYSRATTLGGTQHSEIKPLSTDPITTPSLKTRIPHGEYTIIIPVFPSYGNHVSNRTTAPTFFFFLSLPGSCHPIIHLHPNHTQIDDISIQASLTSCHTL